MLKGYEFSGNSGRNFWIGILLEISDPNPKQLLLILFQEYMATPEPFVFYIVHHVMIMVSIMKGAALRTLLRYLCTKLDCG